jgi:uncharacterized BrkB/YihY/UPF0761 family membrane protein
MRTRSTPPRSVLAVLLMVFAYVAVTSLTTLRAAWNALRRNDIRPRLRRAARALFVAVACAPALAASLALNAVVLHLPIQDIERIEEVWRLPALVSLAVAGL